MKNTETKLPEASPCFQDSYKSMFEKNPNALFVIDDNLNILSANRAFEQLIQNANHPTKQKNSRLPASLPDLLHQLSPHSSEHPIPPASHHYIMEVAVKNNCNLKLHTYTVPDSSQSPQNPNNKNRQISPLIHTSLSCEKEPQTDLSNIEDLKAAKELAASISHEIRNPMTSIRGFLQHLSTKPEFSQHKNNFDLMIEELDWANSILDEYLFLSRNKPCKPARENLNLLIEKLFPLLKASAFSPNQKITLELGKIPSFTMNGKEIRQLIFNLVRNALEAMPDGGEIKIRTYPSDEKTITLAVSDQGSGIAPEYLEKITSPFFTTKENGTGIGLAVCSQIVHKHNAVIEVASSHNGTTFFIHFKQTNT